MLGSPDNGIPVARTPEARRRAIIMPLVIALAVAAVALLLWRGGPDQPRGAGSSLAQPLIERAAGDWRNTRNADNPARVKATGSDWVVDGSAGLDYQPVGSMGGLNLLREGRVDFALADYGMTPEAVAEGPFRQLPLAAGAVAVAANLNGVTGLTLDAPTLAAIYQGRITRWSDAALAALNPGVTLPDTPIVAVHRGDGSGSTNALSLWLAAFSPDWAGGPGVGPQLTWTGGQAADGSRGMIAALTATPGAIGYVEAGQARRAGLTVAALRNAAGQAVLPDAPGLRAALSAVEWAAPAPDAMARAAAPEAYPLTTAIHAFVRADRDTPADTRALLDFVIDRGAGAAESLGYLPLPAEASGPARQMLSGKPSPNS